MALRIELNSPRSNHGVEPISSPDDINKRGSAGSGMEREKRANFSPPHSVNAESEFKFPSETFGWFGGGSRSWIRWHGGSMLRWFRLLDARCWDRGGGEEGRVNFDR